MTNRNEGQKISTAGRPPEGSWMDSGQTRPSWRKKVIRNTTDSGMGSMETQYGLIPPQPGARKRHADDEMLRRRYMDGQNNTNGVQWDSPHKRISFDSEDPESTLSGSESRPGWPPDDLCADSTRYKGSFDEREREGLQLESPVVREKVLKLQRDLEEAKAESRYLRSRPVDGPVVNTNRSRFTMTPVPRYDGISDWDQYREVFEAIVASNGWDDLTAALQLIAHLDGEALNVALLVPDDQRKRPGMLIGTLTAHYTTPGRLAKHRRQFEQMQRPPGEDPAAFAIALETLARRAFVDVDPEIRLQLVRDKFITGQKQLALRRHLDSAGPDTPISSIVDKCRVWESHEESNSRPRMECEPGTSREVFQVRKPIRNDHQEGPTEPDSNSSEFGNLTNRLRELVQQPDLDGSGPIDIGLLLRQLLPIDEEIGEIGQPTSETESVDNSVSGNVD